MDEELPADAPDITLQRLKKEDLYDLSVGDLSERIASLKADITRCEAAIGDRGASKDAAEQLFKA